MMVDIQKIVSDGIKYSINTGTCIGNDDLKAVEKALLLYRFAKQFYPDHDELINFIKKTGIFTEKLCSLFFSFGLHEMIKILDEVLEKGKKDG